MLGSLLPSDYKRDWQIKKQDNIAQGNHKRIYKAMARSASADPLDASGLFHYRGPDFMYVCIFSQVSIRFHTRVWKMR